MSGPITPAPTVDPRNPWATHAARIRAVTPEVDEIATYELEFEDPDVSARYRFAPGQFNMLYLPGIGEAAISISSDPGEPSRLLHTVRVVGNVTRALERRQVGDQVLVRGPFGAGWPVDACRGRDLVIAAGGVGLAPLRPVIYHVLRHRSDYGRVVLLYGARTPAGLLYTHEYDAWEARGLELHVTVDIGDSDWTGTIGVVPSLIDLSRIDGPNTRVITCGPEIMMQYVVFTSLDHGVAAEHVYVSMERNMNCAVGLCGHCQLGPEFVCKDGPVFDYARLAPFLKVEDF